MNSVSAAQENPIVEKTINPEEELHNQAFEKALNQYFPLSPDEIKSIYKAYEKKQIAVSNTYTPVPQGITSTRRISLSPGSEIPVVRLGKGYISSIIFLDKTGQPWPISNFSLGNPEVFNIKWDEASNTLFVQSMKTWGHANIGVRLQDLPTPIMLSLVSGQQDIDYRLDFSVPENGPYAKEESLPIEQNYNFDNALLTYLDGVVPYGVKPLSLEPNIGQAWLDGGKIIVRLKDPLLSPQWMSHTSSSDGTKVYQLNKTATLVVSRQGSPKNVTIKGL